VSMAGPISVSLFVQSLYLLVDIYFVAKLGPSAVAGVSSAGTLIFVTTALAQMLSVGTIALVSQSIGRNDHAEAERGFGQALLLSLLVAVVTMLVGYSLSERYMSAIAGDAAAQMSGLTYLYWFLPGMCAGVLQAAIAAGLRSVGITRPIMRIQIQTVLLNVLLAPILVLGWLSSVPLGVAGAGLASTIAAGAGLVLTLVYVIGSKNPIRIAPLSFKPRLNYWKRILAVGGPAGAEFVLSFVYLTIMYWVVSKYGADAQAAFGIGSRIIQSLLFVPALAISLAAAPIVGQSIGAGYMSRLLETFRTALALSVGCMAISIAVIQWGPEAAIEPFTGITSVTTIGATFLRWMSLALVPQAIIFVCSGVFQGLGNTRPALISSASRLLVFLPISVWLADARPESLEWLWAAALGTACMQATLSLILVFHELEMRGIERPGRSSYLPLFRSIIKLRPARRP
jgi:putative MATE family efflux protein